MYKALSLLGPFLPHPLTNCLSPFFPLSQPMSGTRLASVPLSPTGKKQGFLPRAGTLKELRFLCLVNKFCLSLTDFSCYLLAGEACKWLHVRYFAAVKYMSRRFPVTTRASQQCFVMPKPLMIVCKASMA